MVEAASGPQRKVGENLPPSVNPIIERLGLTEALLSAGRPSYGNRSLWGSTTPVERDFIFGTTGPGWRLDRDRFEDELRTVATHAGADWRTGHRLVGISRREPSGWTIELDTPRGHRRCSADYVVDASGRAARVARLLGVHRVRYDNLVAVVGTFPALTVDEDQEPDAATLVEAIPEGWCYSLALPDNDLLVAYLTDGDLLDRAALRRPGALRHLLIAAPATLARIGSRDGQPFGPLRIRPAHTSRLRVLTGPGWLAVGDAAATYDPLASYGIVAALGAGLYAGEAVAGHLGGRDDAVSSYVRRVDRVVAHYLLLHHGHYGDEQRWPEAPFWSRRHRSPEVRLDARP